MTPPGRELVDAGGVWRWGWVYSYMTQPSSPRVSCGQKLCINKHKQLRSFLNISDELEQIRVFKTSVIVEPTILQNHPSDSFYSPSWPQVLLLTSFLGFHVNF